MESIRWQELFSPNERRRSASLTDIISTLEQQLKELQKPDGTYVLKEIYPIISTALRLRHNCPYDDVHIALKSFFARHMSNDTINLLVQKLVPSYYIPTSRIPSLVQLPRGALSLLQRHFTITGRIGNHNRLLIVFPELISAIAAAHDEAMHASSTLCVPARFLVGLLCSLQLRCTPLASQTLANYQMTGGPVDLLPKFEGVNLVSTKLTLLDSGTSTPRTIDNKQIEKMTSNAVLTLLAKLCHQPWRIEHVDILDALTALSLPELLLLCVIAITYHGNAALYWSLGIGQEYDLYDMNAPDPLNVKPYDDAPEVPKMLEEVGFNQPLTLRDSKVNNSIQDMSWEEHAFPVIDRYLSSLASAIDGEFRAAFSDASYEDEDLNRALRLLCQRSFGITDDEYDYNVINKLLNADPFAATDTPKILKTYVKKIAIAPDTITYVAYRERIMIRQADFDSVARLYPVDKIMRYCMITVEARKQAALLYLVRAVSRYLKT